MLTHLYTSTIETGRTPVYVDCYADDLQGPSGEAAVALAEGTPETIDLVSGGNSLRTNGSRTEYGTTLWGTMAELEALDPSGSLHDRFGGDVDERAYLWRIAWDEHTSSADTVPGSIVYLRPLSGETRRTIAPFVFRNRPLKLRLYDGIAALREEAGEPLTGYDNMRVWLQDTVLTVSRHLPVLWAADARPRWNGAFPPDLITVSRSPAWLQVVQELSERAERGEYGTKYEQVQRVLGGLGMCVYQCSTVTDAPPHAEAPSIYCVHRQFVGQQTGNETTARALRIYPGTGITSDVPTWLPDRTVRVSADDVDADEGGADTVPSVRAVRLAGAGLPNLVPPSFPGNVPLHETVSRSLGRYVAVDTARFRIESTAGGSVPVLRVRLDSPQGTYWLQRDSLGANTASWVTSVTNLAHNIFSGVAQLDVYAAPLPATGEITVEAGSGSWASGTATGLRITVVDLDGNEISDWVVYSNDEGVGEPVSIDRAPAIRAFIQGNWRQPDQWVSELYNEAFPVLDTYQAADRLRQQGSTLEAPNAVVRAMIGPGVRAHWDAVMLGAEDGSVEIQGVHQDGAEIVFDVDVHYTDTVPCVMGGGMVVDLDHAETRGAWTEVTR